MGTKILNLLIATLAALLIVSPVPAAPGNSCGNGWVYDCAGECVPQSTANSWIGDGYCDDGTWGTVLTCAAFNCDGNDCGPVCGTPPPPPAAPSGLTAQVLSSSQIKLNWTDVSNETGYGVEVRPPSSSVFSPLVTVGANITSYTHSGIPCGTVNTYRVRAVNAVGSSLYSNTVTATTIGCVLVVPSPPSISAQPLSSNQIKVNWNTVSSATSYKVYVKNPGSSTYSLLVTLGASTTSFTHGNLQAGATYSYKVRAGNAAGYSPYSNVATATTEQLPASEIVLFDSWQEPLDPIPYPLPGFHAGYRLRVLVRQGMLNPSTESRLDIELEAVSPDHEVGRGSWKIALPEELDIHPNGVFVHVEHVDGSEHSEPVTSSDACFDELVEQGVTIGLLAAIESLPIAGAAVDAGEYIVALAQYWDCAAEQDLMEGSLFALPNTHDVSGGMWATDCPTCSTAFPPVQGDQKVTISIGILQEPEYVQGVIQWHGLSVRLHAEVYPPHPNCTTCGVPPVYIGAFKDNID